MPFRIGECWRILYETRADKFRRRWYNGSSSAGSVSFICGWFWVDLDRQVCNSGRPSNNRRLAVSPMNMNMSSNENRMMLICCSWCSGGSFNLYWITWCPTSATGVKLVRKSSAWAIFDLSGGIVFVQADTTFLASESVDLRCIPLVPTTQLASVRIIHTSTTAISLRQLQFTTMVAALLATYSQLLFAVSSFHVVLLLKEAYIRHAIVFGRSKIVPITQLGTSSMSLTILEEHQRTSLTWLHDGSSASLSSGFVTTG